MACQGGIGLVLFRDPGLRHHPVEAMEVQVSGFLVGGYQMVSVAVSASANALEGCKPVPDLGSPWVEMVEDRVVEAHEEEGEEVLHRTFYLVQCL